MKLNYNYAAMSYPTTRFLKSSKGISIIGIIIFIAFLVAVLNVYAYLNPGFELSKYSIVRLFKSKVDEQRKADLQVIKQAIDKYRLENDDYPAPKEWCGRIISVLHPDAKNALFDYFEQGAIPQDPAFKGTQKDYFYRHVDRNTYILLAVLEDVPSDTPTYSFEGCHDWPGDGVYNYRIIGGE